MRVRLVKPFDYDSDWWDRCDPSCTWGDIINMNYSKAVLGKNNPDMGFVIGYADRISVDEIAWVTDEEADLCETPEWEI